VRGVARQLFGVVIDVERLGVGMFHALGDHDLDLPGRGLKDVGWGASSGQPPTQG
jgi:hypothetical protein